MANIFEPARPIGEEIAVTARDLLTVPTGVHLRLADSADGKPMRPDGHWPLITEIWQELDGKNDYIYVVTADDPDGAFRLKPDDDATVIYGRTNPAQERALLRLCKDRDVPIPYVSDQYGPAFDLPDGYVAGWVGSIYVGCDPEGRISS